MPKIRCECKRVLAYREDQAGKRVKCPACSARIVLPGAALSAAEGAKAEPPGVRHWWSARVRPRQAAQVRHQLVAEAGRSPPTRCCCALPGGLQQPAVIRTRRGQVVNRYRKVKGQKRHAATPSARRLRDCRPDLSHGATLQQIVQRQPARHRRWPATGTAPGIRFHRSPAAFPANPHRAHLAEAMATIMVTPSAPALMRVSSPSSRNRPPKNSTPDTNGVSRCGNGNAQPMKFWVTCGQVVQLAPATEQEHPPDDDSGKQRRQPLQRAGPRGAANQSDIGSKRSCGHLEGVTVSVPIRPGRSPEHFRSGRCW